MYLVPNSFIGSSVKLSKQHLGHLTEGGKWHYLTHLNIFVILDRLRVFLI